MHAVHEHDTAVLHKMTISISQHPMKTPAGQSSTCGNASCPSKEAAKSGTPMCNTCGYAAAHWTPDLARSREPVASSRCHTQL